jgi:hypothetical protein
MKLSSDVICSITLDFTKTHFFFASHALIFAAGSVVGYAFGLR